jgi:uncharacterized protein (DUF1330 family)
LEEIMETTRRRVLTTGAIGLGVAGGLFAIDEHGGQPGDTVGEEDRLKRVSALMERLGDDPVDMLNLLKFKAGGEVSYRRYGMEFGKLIPKYAPGTRVVYQGECAALLVGEQDWDRMLVVRYPSMNEFIALTGSSDYNEIAHLRLAGLERAVLYAIVPSGS